MTEAEIITKAVSRARDNGYKSENPDVDLLLDKDFHRALWGHGPYYMLEAKYQHEFNPDGTNKSIEFRAGGIWEYRMVQIVLADDPIKKLGELLEL